MFQGNLAGIFIAPAKSADLQSVEQADVVVGRGVAGDRHFLSEGTHRDPGHEITLIEAEALEALARECEITLEPAQSRRNLLTRGVPLNHLVGKTFLVGAVKLRGIRLCEPCGHLEKLTCKGVEKGLIHRGGLRAQIIVGGILSVGAPIRAEES